MNSQQGVLIPDLHSLDLLDTAVHDEEQGIAALSCAFGLSTEKVETILAEEAGGLGLCLSNLQRCGRVGNLYHPGSTFRYLFGGGCKYIRQKSKGMYLSWVGPAL